MNIASTIKSSVDRAREIFGAPSTRRALTAASLIAEGAQAHKAKLDEIFALEQVIGWESLALNCCVVVVVDDPKLNAQLTPLQWKEIEEIPQEMGGVLQHSDAIAWVSHHFPEHAEEIRSTSPRVVAVQGGVGARVAHIFIRDAGGVWRDRAERLAERARRDGEALRAARMRADAAIVEEAADQVAKDRLEAKLAALATDPAALRAVLQMLDLVTPDGELRSVIGESDLVRLAAHEPNGALPVFASHRAVTIEERTSRADLAAHARRAASTRGTHDLVTLHGHNDGRRIVLTTKEERTPIAWR